MKKISVLFIVLVLFIFSISTKNSNDIFPLVNANPDYICKKSVWAQPCVINTCWSWSSDWTRVCTWTKTTEVSYYLIRTDCDAWYTKVAQWWNVWWASWKQWADYVSSSQTCTIVQSDRVSPIWDLDVN